MPVVESSYRVVAYNVFIERGNVAVVSHCSYLLIYTQHIYTQHIYISTHLLSTHADELQPAPACAAVGVRAGLVAGGQLGRQGGDTQRGALPRHQPG